MLNKTDIIIVKYPLLDLLAWAKAHESANLKGHRLNVPASITP